MKQLGRISVHGIVKRVVRALPSEVGKPEDLSDDDWSAYQEEDGIFYLHEKYNRDPARARENLVHELVHALIRDTGAAFYLKKMTRLDGEAWDDCEENLVRFLTPALVSALPSLAKVLRKLGAQ